LVKTIKRKSTVSRAIPAFAANRFPTLAAAANGSVPFPATSTLYGGASVASSLGALQQQQNEQLLLAQLAGAQASAAATGSGSLLDMTRQGLLGINPAAAGRAFSHQDILRNAAASLLWKNNGSSL
jgi:hypothetical protein